MKTHTRYLVEKQGAHGPLWHWQPSTDLRRLGWKPRKLLVNSREAAINAAEEMNAELDKWRIAQAEGPGGTGPGGGRPAGARATTATRGTVRALIADYKASRFWRKLAPRTQRDYGHYLDAIDRWAGDQPARGITPVAVQAFYEAMSKRAEGKGRHRRVIETPARGAAAVRVLSALLSAAKPLGYVQANPALQAGISVERQREPVLWTREMLDHMVATADAMGWRSQGTAMLLNFWCGQRQGDVLNLPPWRIADGAIVLKQSKTRKRVVLHVQLVPELVARLEAERERPGTVASTRHLLIHERTGHKWHGYTFTHVFAEIRAAAAKGGTYPQEDGTTLTLPPMPACADLRWMELRHTAVTMLHQAGRTALSISEVTGHTPQSVEAILDRHYLIRTSQGSEEAFKARLAKERGQ